MQGEFEKNIERQLSNFNLEPSPQVWQDIEAVLQQCRKRRVAVWWWLVLSVLLFLVGGGIWWMNDTNKKITIPLKVTALSTQKKINSGIFGSKTESLLQDQPVSVSSALKADPETTNRKSAGKIIMAGNRREFLANDGNFQMNDNDPRVTSLARFFVAQKNRADSTVSLVNIPFVSEKVTSTAQIKTDNTVAGKIALATGKTIDSQIANLDTETKPDRKQEKKNKHQWFITAGSSITRINEEPWLFGGISQTNNSGSSPGNVSSGAGGSGAGNNPIPLLNNGFSFHAGIMYSQNIHRRWQASTGLLYRYLQNRQYVGSDSIALNTSYIYFSNVQKKSLKTNYTHWLQLPLSIEYTINPSSRYQLQLLGGGSVAWVLSEQWLITNKTDTLYPYHYNSSLNNRFIANLHLGIGLNCNNRFCISLLAEQSLTPIHKSTTEKFYWSQFSLQISKPLRLSTHKYKPPKKS